MTYLHSSRDGVLTPAQSVLGAIQGIEVAHQGISSATIVGTSCAILVLLFAIQPFGTTKIATTFAPIVIIWLIFNAICGIYNLAKFDHSVLKAFSPYFAGAYLVRNGEAGWRSLGGLLLAFTGCEALFADLGAFSKRAIQLSWLALAFPCLLLAYIGQAAYISQDASGTAYTNPFFNTVPPGTFYFSLVIAILAAIVASQAMITGSFQLLSQVMAMSYFPHIKTVHTSKRFHGQVYMPLANWLLMIGTVIVTAAYSNVSGALSAMGLNYTDLPPDYKTWKRIWCLRHLRHIHHNMHGLVGCYHHMANKHFHCCVFLPGLWLFGWRLPILSSHEGPNRSLVHHYAGHYSLYYIRPLAIRKRATVVS